MKNNWAILAVFIYYFWIWKPKTFLTSKEGFVISLKLVICRKKRVLIIRSNKFFYQVKTMFDLKLGKICVGCVTTSSQLKLNERKSWFFF